jgi:DNA polymerase-1
VAGFLSSDESIYNDVKAGTDVHSYTAEIIGCSRQEAKAHTFKPLYGGVTGTDSQKRYYNAFKDKYAAVTEWQDEMQRQAVDRGYITLPSGRQYHFPGTKWTKWGTATNRTAICNYPVQGFATGDLLPLALIHLSKLLRQAKMNSVICNTVHDSIVMDVYPGEERKAISMMAEAMLSIKDESHRRYGIHYDMPVDIELKIGDNWLDTELVEL